MSLLKEFERKRRARSNQNSFWPWTLLVISIGIIFFQLGKVTVPTVRRVPQSPTLASPLFHAPVNRVPRVNARTRPRAVKKPSRKIASPSKTKRSRVRSHQAGMVGIGPKLVRE